MKDLTEDETDAAMGESLKAASRYGQAVDLSGPEGIEAAIKNALSHAYAAGWATGMHYGRKIGDGTPKS